MKKSLVILATLMHLVPHPFSVTPVGALALYGGAFGRPRTSWATPLLPILAALLITGVYNPLVMAFVATGLVICTRIGGRLLSSGRSYGRFSAAIVASASAFFLISNFAVWLAGYYPPTMVGLLQCYLAGLPFLFQAMLADAAFCFVLFGLHAAIERQAPAAAIA